MPRVLIAGFRRARRPSRRSAPGTTSWRSTPTAISTSPRTVTRCRETCAWRAGAAARHARGIQADAVVYVSNIDNDPRAVAALAVGRRLWGNSTEALAPRARSRSPSATAFRAAGLAAPDVVTRGDYVGPFTTASRRLAAEAAALGRRGAGPALARSQCAARLLRRRDSCQVTPGSVVFVAARGRAVVLGRHAPARRRRRVRRERVSLLRQPASGRRPRRARQAEAIAACPPPQPSACGVGGVDFIDDGRVMHPIEVNPRWTASMELVERARGVSVFGAHADACTTRCLAVPRRRAPQSRRARQGHRVRAAWRDRRRHSRVAGRPHRP